MRKLWRYTLLGLGILSVVYTLYERPVKHRRTLRLPGEVRAMRFSPDGQILALVADYNTVTLWHVARSRTLHTLRPVRGTYYAYFARDGKTLWTFGQDHTQRWDITTGTNLSTWRTPGFIVSLSKGFRQLVTEDHDQKVSALRVWDLRTGREIRKLPGKPSWKSVSFSRDGTWLSAADASDRGRLHLWDTTTGRERPGPQEPLVGVVATAISPDGLRLATVGGKDGPIQVWDTHTWRLVRSIPSKYDLIYDLRFTGNGSLLAARGYETWNVGAERPFHDSSATLWRVDSGATVRRLPGADLKWLEGRYVVTKNDRTLTLWDATTARKRATFRESEDYLAAVALSDDAKLMASATIDYVQGTQAPGGQGRMENHADSTVKIWDVRLRD